MQGYVTAVDTPVVALFGSTNRHRSGPYGEKHTVVQSGIDLGCNPCHPGRQPGGCSAGSCAVIDGITVRQVMETVGGYTSSISMPNSRNFSLSSS